MSLNRNVEFQIGQIVTSITNKNQRELPSKTELNPREYVKAITLRSGRQLEDPPLLEKEKQDEIEEIEIERKKKETSVGENNEGKQSEDKPSSSTIIPIPLAIPFPQRLKSNKLDKEFEIL